MKLILTRRYFLLPASLLAAGYPYREGLAGKLQEHTQRPEGKIFTDHWHPEG
jgi:hypothetical protein